MAESFEDKVTITKDGKATITLNATKGNIVVGGNEEDGEIHARGDDGKSTVRLIGKLGWVLAGGSGRRGFLRALDENGEVAISLYGDGGAVVGGHGQDGRIVVRDKDNVHGVNITDGQVAVHDEKGKRTILLNGRTGDLHAGGNGEGGTVVLKNPAGAPAVGLYGDGEIAVHDENGKRTIHLNGRTGDLHAGGNGEGGTVVLKNPAGKQVVGIYGNGDLKLGGGGQDGDVVVANKEGKTRIHLDGDTGNVRALGSVYTPGLIVHDEKGGHVLTLSSKNGDFKLGGGGRDGDIVVRNSEGKNRIHLDGETGDAYARRVLARSFIARDEKGGGVFSLSANTGDLKLGGSGRDGDIVVRNKEGKGRIHLDGDTGNVVGRALYTTSAIIRNTEGGHVLTLSANTGDIKAGGEGVDGDIIVRDKNGNETIRLEGSTGKAIVEDIVVRNEGGTGTIPRAGGDIVANRFIACDESGNHTIHLDGAAGNVVAGGNGQDGDVVLKNTSGQDRIQLYAECADVRVGGAGRPGDVFVRDGSANSRAHLGGADGKLILKNADGGDRLLLLSNSGSVLAGGAGQAGGVFVRNKNGHDTIALVGEHGHVHIGGRGFDEGGRICLKDHNGTIFYLDATERKFLLRDKNLKDRVVLHGSSGQIQSRDPEGRTIISLCPQNARIIVGDHGRNGHIRVRNGSGQDAVHIDGKEGDIKLLNADLAEDFDISMPETVDAGTVMVLDEAGALRTSDSAYDRRVAGVISGAGTHKPGIVLDKRSNSDHRLPIALVGKVYCKVDATQGAIAVGDLLTTSPTPGHAMKVSDNQQALGAILGKAMGPLADGKGLIPVLVALQ